MSEEPTKEALDAAIERHVAKSVEVVAKIPREHRTILHKGEARGEPTLPKRLRHEAETTRYEQHRRLLIDAAEDIESWQKKYALLEKVTRRREGERDAEIERLKAQLAERDAEIERIRIGSIALNRHIEQLACEARSLHATGEKRNAAMKRLHDENERLRAQLAAVASSPVPLTTAREVKP